MTVIWLPVRFSHSVIRQGLCDYWRQVLFVFLSEELGRRTWLRLSSVLYRMLHKDNWVPKWGRCILLTFDLSLAIEWLCFLPPSEQNPTFWVSSPLSPLLSLRYLSQEKTSKQISCPRQRVGFSGSFYRSVIVSLLCPNIKTWLLGPGYYYRIIILACKQRYLCFKMWEEMNLLCLH